MKKFFLYLFLTLTVLGAIFSYLLYTEGAFDAAEATKKNELKPFEMKCEAGKCETGKCGEN